MIKDKNEENLLNEDTLLLDVGRKKSSWTYLNDKGIIPFSKHLDEEGKVKHHYAATAASFLLLGTSIFIILFAVNGFTKVGNEFLSNLSHVFRVLVSVATFGLISLGAGAVAATTHYGINKCREAYYRKKGMDFAASKDLFIGSETREVQRAGKCDPRRLFFPGRPGKTFGWFILLTAAGLTIASAINPTFFNAVKDSDYGLVMAEIFVSLTGGAIAGAVGIALHASGVALWNKCCGRRARVVQFFDDEAKDTGNQNNSPNVVEVLVSPRGEDNKETGPINDVDNNDFLNIGFGNSN